ncbi:MAG: FAD-binding oxidoreductase [Armatimonadetes bacterium]|nr:FAD-binding oxidoreductase [Armatimonadota bacterium]
MSITTADVVICGAGVSGATTAYQLAVKHGVKNIVIVDPLSPLSMTSDKSMECYRNWWPGPDDAMVSLMNRSIDMLEQLHQEAPDRLHMHRRGYLYATSDPNKVAGMVAGAEESTQLGAGPLRVYRGEADDPQYVPVSEHGLMDVAAVHPLAAVLRQQGGVDVQDAALVFSDDFLRQEEHESGKADDVDLCLPQNVQQACSVVLGFGVFDDRAPERAPEVLLEALCPRDGLGAGLG